MNNILKQNGVTRDDAGNVVYRGQSFPGFGKPIRDSGNKQGKVLVRRGDRIKIVRFGDPSLADNQSVEANDRFYARFGNNSNIDDPFSPLYWSARWLWPRGSLKGEGPKPFATLKKANMTQEEINKQMTFEALQDTFTESEQTVCDMVMSQVEENGGGSDQQQAACAAAVRGMRSGGGSVERSLDTPIEKRTFRDKERAITEALRVKYGNDNNRFVYAEDFDEDYVYFELDGQLYREGYVAADAEATLADDRVEANRETLFVVPDESVERGLQKQTRTVRGQELSASDYAYVPDPDRPSTWKLRIDTARNVAGAVAALGPGFRGNRVEIPEDDRPAVIRRVRAAYRRFFPERVEEDGLPDVLKSLMGSEEVENTILNKLAKLLGIAVGDPSGSSSLKLKKQFDDSTKTTTEFFYVAPNEVDGVGDIYLEEDAQPMIDSFNKAIDEGRLQSGLFHKHKTDSFTVVKAYLAEEDCTIGEFDIVKGQPLVDIQYNNPALYELRKAGEVTGPSIGARAKEIIIIEDGVEKSIGEGEVELHKGLSLDDLKAPIKPKRILKGINFDWPNPELTLTDPSQGGACSLKNDIILEKSLKPNDAQEAILKKIEEEFTPLLKALGEDNTSVDSQNQKGNDNDMSVEMQKQLDQMAQDLAISKAENKLTKYNFDEEVQADLAKAIVVGGDVEAVIKALDAMVASKEEAVTKAAEEASKTVENPVAKALSEEKGDADEAEEEVEKSLMDRLAEVRSAQEAK